MTGLEREMIHWGKMLFDRHLISGWGGNISCRSGPNRFLITGQHSPLGFLGPRDLVRIDGSGRPLNKKQRASSETPMHMAIYDGTEAAAIIHVHPPMVLAFSLSQEVFVPLSFEEKYTLGEVPVIAQDTPTVTEPGRVVEALRYSPAVIIKGHGTVAVGESLQEAFLLTDLLEEAVRCQFFREGAPIQIRRKSDGGNAVGESAQNGVVFELFSRSHMQALVDAANADSEFRLHGANCALTTSLTLCLDDTKQAWTVRYRNGEITDLTEGDGGEFMITGKSTWWEAVFCARIDPFLATQQGKLKLKRGELAQLSRWYQPFQRAFALWQTIPIR